MNEVEKMYKNCKIKKQYCGWLDMGDLDTQYKYIRCNSLEEWKEAALMSRTREKDWDKPSAEYPPFTAEKQLELIKWLASKQYARYTTSLLINIRDTVRFAGGLIAGVCTLNVGYDKQDKEFKNALAGLINEMWQDLTEEEKQQIKEILE